jgi:hypothetical protein
MRRRKVSADQAVFAGISDALQTCARERKRAAPVVAPATVEAEARAIALMPPQCPRCEGGLVCEAMAWRCLWCGAGGGYAYTMSGGKRWRVMVSEPAAEGTRRIARAWSQGGDVNERSRSVSPVAQARALPEKEK